MPDIDHETSEQTACEACVLLNQAIRELIVPKRVWALVDQWKNVDNPISLNESCAISNMILRGVIMNLYRLRETREGFLAGWLFTETELLGLGFQPIEQFFPAGTWKCFEMIRHQYAGHATGTEAKPEKKQPARILSPAKLGKALKETGLVDLKTFLDRVQTEVLPGVERVRDELTSRYPSVRNFVTQIYPLKIDEA